MKNAASNPATLTLRLTAGRILAATLAVVVLSLGAVVPARDAVKEKEAARSDVTLATPVAVAEDVQLAAARIEPDGRLHSELSPVSGRELLRGPMPAAAERARTEGLTDLPSASPAAGQVAHAHSPVASVVRPPVTTMLMEVTAYCPCTRCCGPQAQGITASGKRVDYNGGLFVAADPKHKFGTKLVIPGYAGNRPVEVIDRGGAIKGNKLDVYFDSHEEARQWGRRKLFVELVE